MRPESVARAHTLWQRFVGGPGLTLTLAAVLVLTVVWPLQQARWVPGLPPLILFAAAGLAFAVIVHRDGWSTRLAYGVAAALGFLVAFGVAAAMTTGFDAIERIVNLIREISQWVGAFGGDQVKSGLLEFPIFLIMLSWVAGFLAARWALGGRQGWPTVLLGGLVLTLALSNSGSSPARPLALFMAASALLLIHLTTTRSLATWRARRLTFDPITVLSQSGAVLALGLVIVLAVAALPTPARAPFGVVADSTRSFVEAAQAEFSRLFNGLPSRRAYRTISFEDETQFTGNPNLTDELLFTVQGDRATYWRARTYSRYTSDGWETPDSEWVDEELLETRVGGAVLEDSHTFRVSAATDTLFAGGLFAGASISAEGLVGEDAPWDVYQVRFSEGREFFDTRTDLVYTSTGVTPNPSPNQLRAASTNYPRWVEDAYLGLPGTVPQRVVNLAWEIAGRLDNTYDQVEAIRSHVLSYPYNLDIAGPPDGQDGVDYFLFDLKEGYCDYFASATAVLLRALGIPARYVLGYAPGQYDADRGEWTVLDLNYHSWVEAYFPGHGWIVFEATPPDAIEFGGVQGGPQEALENPDSEFGDIDEFLDEEEANALLPSDLNLDPGFHIQTWMIVALAGLVGVAALSAVWQRWWWSLSRYGRPAERYAKMARLAGLMGLPVRPSQTPGEYGAALAREVPEADGDIREVVSAYVRHRYSGGGVPEDQIAAAETAWRRLRWTLMKRLLRVRPA